MDPFTLIHVNYILYVGETFTKDQYYIFADVLQTEQRYTVGSQVLCSSYKGKIAV